MWMTVRAWGRSVGEEKLIWDLFNTGQSESHRSVFNSQIALAVGRLNQELRNTEVVIYKAGREVNQEAQETALRIAFAMGGSIRNCKIAELWSTRPKGNAIPEPRFAPCDWFEAGESNQISVKGSNVIYKADRKCNPKAGNQTFAVVWERREAIRFQKLRKSFAK